MRRLVVVALLALAPLGLWGGTAGAQAAHALADSPVILAFDFSDNSQPASVSHNGFNITADVLSLTGDAGGVVRIVAIAPANSQSSNLVCGFQAVRQGQVECAFNFTATGVWRIRAEWAPTTHDTVAVVSQTVLRVSN